MFDTFRVHLHDSGVQAEVTPDDHEAIRVTLVADDPEDCPVGAGVIIEGSNDQINWYTVSLFFAGDVNEEANQPFLYLRVRGYGNEQIGCNGTLVVEYLDAALADTSPLTIDGTVDVSGSSVEATLSEDDLSRESINNSLLDEILAELRKQTAILEEMSA